MLPIAALHTGHFLKHGSALGVLDIVQSLCCGGAKSVLRDWTLPSVGRKSICCRSMPVRIGFISGFGTVVLSGFGTPRGCNASSSVASHWTIGPELAGRSQPSYVRDAWQHTPLLISLPLISRNRGKYARGNGRL